MASSRTTARLRRQASLAADLATGPQASVLRQALSEALSNYKFGVHQARGVSGVVRKSATEAVPQMQQYFDTAGQSLQRNLQSVGIDPATVQGPAKADILDTVNRLAATAATSKAELTSRANDAAAGLQFQVGNLASQFAGQTNKINTQLAGLSATRGKTAESTLLQLLNQEEGRALTRRGQNLSHEDRQAAQDALGNYRSQTLTQGQERIDVQRQKAAAKGGSKTTKESQSAVKLKRDIQNAQGLLKQGHSVRYLSHTLNAPPDVLQAATDLQDFGHLMPDTVNNLRRLKVRVPRSWLPAKSNIPSNKR